MFGDYTVALPQDNLCTRGVQTTAGSRVLRGHVPAYDATAVARLRAAGAVLVGKTNMDSFGMGSSTENSDFGVRPAGGKLIMEMNAFSDPLWPKSVRQAYSVSGHCSANHGL